MSTTRKFEWVTKTRVRKTLAPIKAAHRPIQGRCEACDEEWPCTYGKVIELVADAMVELEDTRAGISEVLDFIQADKE